MNEKNNLLFAVSFLASVFLGCIQTKDNFLDRNRSDYEFYFTPTWIHLDDPHHINLFDKTIWVLVGTFTIYMKEPSYLSALSLKWVGPEPTAIHSASLYRSNGKTLKATDNYLIADGQWYRELNNQKLIFDFPNPEKLHVSNRLYLVLTITKDSEDIINKGTFQILPENLPQSLQRGLNHSPIYLTLAPPATHLQEHTS